MGNYRFTPCLSCGKPMPSHSPVCPHCGLAVPRGLAPPGEAPGSPRAKGPSAALVQKVSLKLQNTKGWRVRTAEGRWVCPFCGEAAADRLLAPLAARHLMDCPRYRDKTSKNTMAVEELRARADLLSIREEAEYRLSTADAWNVQDADGGWICPFCGAIPEVNLPKEGAVPAEALDRITAHLTMCEGYHRGAERGLDALEMKAALKRANTIASAKRLTRSQIFKKRLWQFWDDEGYWCCPFCTEVTEVCVPHGAQITEDTLREIAIHLLGCSGYRMGKGAPRSEDFLQKSLVLAIRKKRTRYKLLGLLTANPAWRHRDRFGLWVCPYCQTAALRQETVPEEKLAEALYQKVFEHITRQCAPFQSLLAVEGEGGPLSELGPDEVELVTLIRDQFRALEEATRKAPPGGAEPPPPPPGAAPPLEGEIVAEGGPEGR